MPRSPRQMRQVTKEELKELYVTLGGGTAMGWDLKYWNECLADNTRTDMKYLVQEPETPDHTRMMIVTDYGRNEHRLFFVTEEAEERLFDSPAKE